MKQNKFPLEPREDVCINRNLLGWHKQMIVYDVFGCDWNIETYKWEGAIRCCAEVGYADQDILFIPANRPLLRLYWERRYCTKNAVIQVHKAGLKRFDQMVASGIIQVPQHIKYWVKNQKLRDDIAKYPKTTSYTQPNTHL